MQAHKLIRPYREANDVSPAELAKRLCIAESTLRSLENGNRKVTPGMAVALERETGIPRAEFCPEIFNGIPA